MIKDTALILFSVIIAFGISQLDLIEKIFSISEDIRMIGSFIGGLFFTSIFTTAPAIVLLGEISQVEPLLTVALIGAFGAVIGDLVIFYFFRNHVANDLEALLRYGKRKTLKLVFKNPVIRWFAVIIGALIIASPLPDELGIAMMGISKIKYQTFLPISFVFNFLGILAIGIASRLIS